MDLNEKIGARPVAGLDEAANVLVTGASSGIGLAMVRQLLANEGVARVFAVSRNASGCAAINALRQTNGERLQPMDVDLASEVEIERLAVDLRQRVDALHLIINAAGVLHAADIKPEKSLEQVTQASLERVFSINAFAPILLAKALMPLLTHGKPAVFASLSARVGSISDNRSGGWYAYRASKAAQNQLLKTLSIEMARRNPQACCVLLHPGTVDTPLSAPFQGRVPADRLFSTERAADQLLQILARCTREHSGRFFAWDGSEVAW